ncbi:MAG: hypothetical protein J5X22_02620 [Candidatus Accumulibacter sp.]|uniref:hypothetical protein n=2 Tax=Accumulibacter sp. TaxID=2053492 RepID=UPI001B00AC7D|nr:hypothetical protein [Accumulibacter sp.]MBO3709435.1 hypothetical protein [Accumulibacter sp.]
MHPIAMSRSTFFHFSPGSMVLRGIALWAGAVGLAAAFEPAVTCPISFPVHPPTQPAQRQAEASRLAGLEEPCQDRADYFAYQGVLLLTLGRPQKAALALEKALLLDPDLAGTQLDYAQALAEIGQRDSAISLASDVSQHPDIPFALQAWLSEQLGVWKGDGWLLDWSVEFLGGAESNLNSAPGIQFLTLTLPGGSVPVQLADNERIPGGAARTAWVGSAARAWGGGMVLFNGEISTRNSPGKPETNQAIVSANAAYFHPFLNGQIGLRFGQTRLWMANQPTYTSTGWGLLYQLPPPFAPAGCASNLGYSDENRDFPAAPLQAGRYSGPKAWLFCRGEVWDFNVLLQDRKDRARDSDRLGGDQRRSDITLGIARRLGPDTVSLWVQRGRDLDDLPYSSLLGGQPRRVDRLAGRLSYEHPLADQWSIVAYLENTLQKSNIALFNMENHAIYFGLKFHGR